ncbi:MAG: hypothetical protein AVDCRST_MAG40-710 [uncultured Gemmatimonadaceae bacterium]|uniref:Uncharacterized protein n=1 Tax=uncultured Gemmatimonadaceae bacterium TaxID=246130 RepID=A0A6J4KJF2_9BACT|nr:MAG: hypothetical protein AVDCRST_MAG40-710 [uncultured Gemmatimonadaceae bacterium]
MAPQPAADRRVAVALVAGERGGASARAPRPPARDTHGVQHARGVHALVRLAGAERDGQGEAAAVSYKVQLRGEAATAAPQRVVRGFARWPVFPRARGDAMRADVAAVDAPERPVDLPGLSQVA